MREYLDELTAKIQDYRTELASGRLGTGQTELVKGWLTGAEREFAEAIESLLPMTR